MKHLIDNTKRKLPKAFESEEYAKKREETIKGVEEERKELFDQLNERAQEEGFVLRSSPTGLLILPVVDGKPLNEEEFRELDLEKKKEIKKKREKLNEDLRAAMRELKGLESKANEKIEELNREIVLNAIEHLIIDLKETYNEFPDVISYIEAVEKDIADNFKMFIKEPQDQSGAFPARLMKELTFRKYEVNVVVDNADRDGCPVIIERNPTYPNLFGKTEKEAQFGVLNTDFTMIRPGSLHKANGGYLVLPVKDLLQSALSWGGLKRSLREQQIVIEEAGERLGYISTKGLKPAPIPLDIKIVLIGDSAIYQALYTLDEDFKELFKVKADFDTTMDREEVTMKKYAAFICTLCQKEDLTHLDASAVARVIEYGSRLADDREKLSTRFSEIADIVREADFYASKENTDLITSTHVKKAIEEKIYRSKLIQEKIQEMIQRGILLIDTEGEDMGQVNGLSVMSTGEFSFGRPSRVTASIGLGREGIIDIEREAELGGPIHTKGILILSGYLERKYAQDKPLSLSAHLVFEQSYSGVEGDSASSTELYAILSSLSELPINQGIAVTGSINQQGEIQAIGGVNEKIEGYFEVCKRKGLTGNQGVMIPGSNVQNLMLKEEVVDAVEEGKFHIYPVNTVDEGIEILTGVPAGERTAEGEFEKDTVNYKVDKRLREMAEQMQEYARPRKDKKS